MVYYEEASPHHPDNVVVCVDFFYIEEEFRNKGIGSEVLRMVQKNNPGRNIELSTAFGSEIEHLYERMGGIRQHTVWYFPDEIV